MNGILHRDIKPENLVLDSRGNEIALYTYLYRICQSHWSGNC